MELKTLGWEPCPDPREDIDWDGQVLDERKDIRVFYDAHGGMFYRWDLAAHDSTGWMSAGPYDLIFVDPINAT